jgi:hypothetical protein
MCGRVDSELLVFGHYGIVNGVESAITGAKKRTGLKAGSLKILLR